jgi:hypothetical protein
MITVLYIMPTFSITTPQFNMLLSLITVADVFAIFSFLYLIVAFRDHQRRRGLPYPPGPPCWPVIGNFLDVPKLSPWAGYLDMSRKHGRDGFFAIPHL